MQMVCFQNFCCHAYRNANLNRVSPPHAVFDPNDLFYEHTNDSRRSPDDLSDSERSDDRATNRPWHHQPVHYVYDAAAERMKERLKEGQLNSTNANTNAVGVVH